MKPPRVRIKIGAMTTTSTSVNPWRLRWLVGDEKRMFYLFSGVIGTVLDDDFNK